MLPVESVPIDFREALSYCVGFWKGHSFCQQTLAYMPRCQNIVRNGLMTFSVSKVCSCGLSGLPRCFFFSHEKGDDRRAWPGLLCSRIDKNARSFNMYMSVTRSKNGFENTAFLKMFSDHICSLLSLYQLVLIWRCLWFGRSESSFWRQCRDESSRYAFEFMLTPFSFKSVWCNQ